MAFLIGDLEGFGLWDLLPGVEVAGLLVGAEDPLVKLARQPLPHQLSRHISDVFLPYAKKIYLSQLKSPHLLPLQVVAAAGLARQSYLSSGFVHWQCLDFAR
jgi:hypothetical protein